MGRRRARLLEQDRPNGPSVARLKADASRSADVEPVAREVMRLQKSGGNEAVSTMLARKVTKTADRDSPADDQPITSTIVLDDPIGVLPLLSFSRDGDEYKVTVPSSGQDPVLMEAAAKGTKIAKVVISARGTKITLTEVYISSVNLGGRDEPMLSMTLNYATQSWGDKDAPGKLD